MGPDEDGCKDVALLNPIIRLGNKSLKCEVGNRHAEIIADTHLGDKSYSVETPGTREEDIRANTANTCLSPSEAAKYEACAARAKFLLKDPLGIQFATTLICRAMSNPTDADMTKLKRLARYIKGASRAAYA